MSREKGEGRGVRRGTRVVGILVAEFFEGDVDFLLEDLVALKVGMLLALRLEQSVNLRFCACKKRTLSWHICLTVLKTRQRRMSSRFAAPPSSSMFALGVEGWCCCGKNLELRRKDGGLSESRKIMSATQLTPK